MTPNLHTLIDTYATKYQLPGDLCAALVFHESKGIYWASRFEEKWFAAKLLLLPSSRLAGFVPSGGTPSLYDEKVWRAHSWGLTQIMGDRARILGFKGDYLPELISCPELSLDYGLRYLRQCFGSEPPRTQLSGPGKPFSFSMLQFDEDFARARAALLRYNGGADLTYPNEVFKVLLSLGYLKMIEWEPTPP